MYLGKLQVLALRNQLSNFKTKANTKKIVLFLSPPSYLGFEEKREVRKVEEKKHRTEEQEGKRVFWGGMHLLRCGEVA